MPDFPDKPKPPRPVVPPPNLKAAVRPSPPPPSAAAGKPLPPRPLPPRPVAPAAAGAAKPPSPPGTETAGPARKGAPGLGPAEIASVREEIVETLKASKRSGEPVTMTVEHKELTFSGRVIRIEPAEGYAVLENVDGRRRGCYFILGGSLTTKDGRRIAFPIDGVPR